MLLKIRNCVIRFCLFSLLAIFVYACKSTTVIFPTKENEFFLTQELNDLIINRKVSVVIRVPQISSSILESENKIVKHSSESNLNSSIKDNNTRNEINVGVSSSSQSTEKNISNQVYNSVENQFVKSGYLVRDRSIFNNLLQGNTNLTRYSEISNLTNTDLIIEVLEYSDNFKYYSNQLLKSNSNKTKSILKTDELIIGNGMFIEYRVIIIKSNQIAGRFKFFKKPCEDGCTYVKGSSKKKPKIYYYESSEFSNFIDNSAQELIRLLKNGSNKENIPIEQVTEKLPESVNAGLTIEPTTSNSTIPSINFPFAEIFGYQEFDKVRPGARIFVDTKFDQAVVEKIHRELNKYKFLPVQTKDESDYVLLYHFTSKSERIGKSCQFQILKAPNNKLCAQGSFKVGYNDFQTVTSCIQYFVKKIGNY